MLCVCQALHALTHIILKAIFPGDRSYYHLSFTDEETEAQKD